ncbi:MAG: hypothetical protein VKN56_12870, partial [Cyanobacteriota bacterium]|nr:hypothetical protein [Cyanobacteriota bacterium]
MPLACTLLTTLVLLLVPSLLLGRLPRPQAIGLEKLMAQASLLQSFRASPDRPVPEVWRQRFGMPLAEKLWRLQTRTWWQFWDGHAEAQPFLALPLRGLPPALLTSVAVPPLTVGDLAIFPPDLLSRQILSSRLLPEVRRSGGLRLRCLPRLEHEQAVFWRPSALGVLLGPLAPFLQNYQEGCLSLTIRGDGLLWTGEAASVEGMVLQLPARGVNETPWPVMNPSASDELLEVQGSSLERLLAGLLARELIRQPLAERYGLGPVQISLLRQTPFRLLLKPKAQGPFQASMEVTVMVGNQQSAWKELLVRLSKALEKEGLRPLAKPTAPPKPTEAPKPTMSPPTASAPGPMALWQRKDGVVVGGWLWSSGNGSNEQITLFLGPPPSQPGRVLPERFLKGEGMLLMARPQKLATLGLLPPDLPEVVKRSAWLWFA